MDGGDGIIERLEEVGLHECIVYCITLLAVLKWIGGVVVAW